MSVLNMTPMFIKLPMNFHRRNGPREQLPTIPDGIPSGSHICIFVLCGRRRIAELWTRCQLSFPKFGV